MYPEFRQGDLDFYLVWEHCVRDEHCYGLLDILVQVQIQCVMLYMYLIHIVQVVTHFH